MIYLLTGNDKYRVRERLQNILSSHQGEAGDINISTIESGYDFAKIKSEAESLPFLSDKRLLVIKNMLHANDKQLLEKTAKWLPNVPETTDIVFIEEEMPDQRTALYKAVIKNGKAEILSELKVPEAVAWIKKMATTKGATIDPEAASLLQLYCGSDLARLTTELEKLIAYDSHITKTNVENLVDAGFFNTVFELTDAISEKKAKRALDILSKSLDAGENEIYLIAMLARQIRNLLIVKDLSEHRISEDEIVRKTKLHPFVVKKSLSQSRNFTKNQLIAFHGRLVRLDFAVKSTSNDPKILLQKFVAEMTS